MAGGYQGDPGSAEAAAAALGNGQTMEDVARAVVEAERAQIHTSVPAKVVVDSDGKTVRLQPTVKVPRRKDDGSMEYVQLPEIEAIVHQAGGGDTALTLPIKTGNEGFVSFGMAAFDAWQANGGVQQAVSTRTHQLSDGMFVPGIRSKPRDLPDISTEAAETRSDDGKHRTITHPKNGVKVTVNGGKQVFDVNAKTGQVEVVSKTVTLAAGDAKAGRGPNTENTADRQLNEALKGLRAEMSQVKDSHHALFDAVSKLRMNVESVVPALVPVNAASQITGALSGAPDGLDAMKALAEGKLQGYFQNALKDALQSFLDPSRLLGAGSVLDGGIEALIAGIEAQIAKLIELNPILARVDDLQRQAEAILTRGATPEVEAAQLKPVQDALAAIAKDNPAVAVLQGLQSRLKGLVGQAGPGLSFLEPQKQIAQGVIKSMRLSEGT